MSRTHMMPWDDNGMVQKLFPRKRLKQSAAVNRQEFARTIIQRRFMEMLAARYQWKGLPYTCDPTYLEHLLITNGQAIVGIHQRSGRLVGLQASTVGSPNYQNEYVAYKGTGPNFSEVFPTLPDWKTVDGVPVQRFPTGVPVFNNSTRSGDLPAMLYYADRIAELDTTIDINSMNTRRNKVVYASTDTELATSNILSEMAAGEPIIRSRSPELAANITTLDLSVHPDMVDRLHIFRGRLWNEAMMEFGIDNTNQDKKERMVTEELGGNDDQVARIRTSGLRERRKAAERITLLMRANGWGPNHTVTVDYDTQDDPAADDVNTERVDDGRVHADAE